MARSQVSRLRRETRFGKSEGLAAPALARYDT